LVADLAIDRPPRGLSRGGHS